MSLIHVMEYDGKRFSPIQEKNECVYVKFLLEKCRKEKNSCTAYEKALTECQEGKTHFGKKSN